MAAPSVSGSSPVTGETMTPVIEARQVSKHFGHVIALRGVDLKLWPNEVLGVVGDNGAGKSTLMKVLSGVHPASDGEMLIDGESVRFSNPGDARRMGIEMVYQDLALAGNMRIDENIFLGREHTRGIGPFQLVDHKANQVKAMEHLDNLKIHVKSVSQRVEELSGGQRQAVAVARATAFKAKVVIMDEPTAALAVKEVGKVLDMIKDLRDQGISVILISHRLDDVFYVCDRVMALFHGRNFAEAPLNQIERNDVVGWIMGNKSGQGVDPALDRNSVKKRDIVVTDTTFPAQLDDVEDEPRRLVTAMAYIDRWGVLFLVGLMLFLSWISQPDYALEPRNLANIFRQNSFYALLALGQFIVIVTAGIDLSVGSVMALSAMSAAVLADGGAAWPIVFVAPFVVGLGVGTINGLGLTKLHMPHPFIMTLGMLFIARGATNLISGGVPVSGLPDQVRFLGADSIQILGVQVPVSLFVIIGAYFAVWLFLQHGRRGRHIFAIGGNPEAARVSGVRVDRTLVLAYALCGLMAGFAGLLLAGRTNSGFPAAGTGDELYAIAAVIIGGASFFGGRGTVLGVFAGVLVIGLLRNLLNLNAVPSFWQQVAIGVVIIVVVAFDVFRRRVAASA